MNTPTSLQNLDQEVWQRPFVRAHQKWCDDFVLELRLRDVPGPVIGERLGEIERHCADTAETPSEAFGEPTDYAARIHEASSSHRVSGVWTIAVVSAAQVLAMLVGTAAVQHWARGDSLTYNAVQIVCLGLVVLLLLGVPELLRPLLRHPWAFGIPLVTVTFLGAGSAALSERSDLPVIVQLPAPTVAVGLYVVVLVLAWVEYRELASDAGDDRVTSPLAPTDGRPGTTGRRRRWTALVPSCLVPAYYLALAGFTWLIG